MREAWKVFFGMIDISRVSFTRPRHRKLLCWRFSYFFAGGVGRPGRGNPPMSAFSTTAFTVVAVVPTVVVVVVEVVVDEVVVVVVVVVSVVVDVVVVVVDVVVIVVVVTVVVTLFWDCLEV